MMRLKKTILPVAILLALSSGLVITGCDTNEKSAQAAQAPTINVKVFKVEPLKYTVKFTLPARVVASQIAEIRPQVSGIILKREFDESSNVTAGQSLYQIDPALYQASYDSALASLASAKASANIAKLTLNRYTGLLKTKSISQQDYDKAAADSQQADASVLVAQAQVHTAKVNLDYTKVYSPIDGYIGKSSVTEGALVSSGQTTALAVVQQLDPIYVDMTEAAIKYEKNISDAGLIYKPAEKVEIYFANGSKYEHQGHIKFSDKSVDESTGTVTLRASFPNPKTTILPGIFIKPKVTLGYIDNAVLVPQRAVTSDIKGTYTTKIVNKEGIIESRDNIEVYTGIGGYWVITKGIDVGEQVIVSGLLSVNTIPAGVKAKANIIEEPTKLTQQELDQLSENSTK